jgi:putative FmdB family regulatory protein
MPFYEYECENCKFYLETMQKISDAPLKKCPSCGKSTLKKLISAPNFRLKGAGWYETDFKSENENKRNLAGADKEEAKPAEAAATEPKPAEAKAPDTKTAGAKPAAPAAVTTRKTAKAPARKPAAKPATRAASRAKASKKAKAPKRKARR